MELGGGGAPVKEGDWDLAVELQGEVGDRFRGLVRAEAGQSRGRHGELGLVTIMVGGEAVLGTGTSSLGGRSSGEGLGRVAVANGRGKEALKGVLGWRAPGGRGG